MLETRRTLMINDRRRYNVSRYPSRQSQGLCSAHRAFLLDLFFRVPASEDPVTRGQSRRALQDILRSVNTCCAIVHKLRKGHCQFSVRKASEIAFSQVAYSCDITTLWLTLDCVQGHSMRALKSEDQHNGGIQGEVPDTAVPDEEVEASDRNIPSLGTWRTLKSTKRFERIIRDTPEQFETASENDHILKSPLDGNPTRQEVLEGNSALLIKKSNRRSLLGGHGRILLARIETIIVHHPARLSGVTTLFL